MALNPEAVGSTSEPRKISWTSSQCLLYSVGLGAGHDDLPFVTENTAGCPQRVYPTFAVVASLDPAALGGDVLDNAGTFDWAMLVHGSQSVTVNGPIPPDGEATVVERIVAMHDKGKAAVIVIETNASAATGEQLWSTRSSMFIRGAGGWGGDRGPSGPQHAPPADRSPDHVVTIPTSVDQAFVYRLSGDRNPLHSDPAFAAQGGFERPILHGLCTYGITGRALLGALCDNEVDRFQHIEGRFSAPVIPGDELTTRIWRTGSGDAVFTTSVGDRVVIDQGLARFG